MLVKQISNDLRAANEQFNSITSKIGDRLSKVTNQEHYIAPSQQINVTAKAAARVLLEHNRFLIMTGAGISAPSGIPTFRGAEGFWR